AVGLRQQLATSTLGMTYFVVAVAYNCTEGGFKMMHPAWIALLLAVSRVREPAESNAQVPLVAPARHEPLLMPSHSSLTIPARGRGAYRNRERSAGGGTASPILGAVVDQWRSR